MNEKIHRFSIWLRVLGRTTQAHCQDSHSWLYTPEAVFPLVRTCSYKYGFFLKIGFLMDFCTDFFKNTDFWTFVRIFGFLYGFFLRDHFHRFYSLILLFCELCECDTICCELCDDKYQKSLVSILFSCFFM